MLQPIALFRSQTSPGPVGRAPHTPPGRGEGVRQGPLPNFQQASLHLGP